MNGSGVYLVDSTMNSTADEDKSTPSAYNFCKDFVRGFCNRENCKYLHEKPPKSCLKELFRFCHDYQNKGCFRQNCKFIHCAPEDEEKFYTTGVHPQDPRFTPVCTAFLQRACDNKDCSYLHRSDVLQNDSNMLNKCVEPSFRQIVPKQNEDCPPSAKLSRIVYESNGVEHCINPGAFCSNCESLEHKVKLLYENISVLLNKVADLSEKNAQLTSMNEFLLEQTASLKNDQPCVITSRHGTSAPVSLATVSMTPIVSLAGGLPTLVPAAATSSLTLAPAASRAQILTPAPQIIAVSTTQQIVGNSGTLIVTSAGAQQLMQVSDSGTIMGAGQTVVAVTPAQLTLAQPAQQLISSAPQTAVQQLVQQSGQLVQPQMATQHPGSQYAAAQQSVQHLSAQQSAQHLVAQHSAQQQLAAQQSAQQQLAAQQLVHQTSTQQITISSTSQPIAISNQAQPLAFPILSQSILPH